MNSLLPNIRVMWIIVFFDLPTQTFSHRKQASLFRKKLIKSGFRMMQYSVYKRYVVTRESLEVQKRRIISFLPPEGKVDLLLITDKTHSNMLSFYGREATQVDEGYKLLTLF